MLFAPIVIVFIGLGLAVCLFALWLGGPAERIGAAIVLANLLLTTVLGKFADGASLPIWELVGDGLTALGLLVVVLRYGSLWLGGVMLLYAAQFTLHSFYLVTDRPPDLFHAAANNLDFLAVLLCLAAGTMIAMRRRAKQRAA